MTLDTAITIQETSDYNNTQYFEMLASHGHLTTVFRHESGQYTLADIEVEKEFRRQGIGKLLIQSALEHAVSIEASYAQALIVSRECLKAITQVCGSENVDITRKGTYTKRKDLKDRRDASAKLYLPLKEQQPQNIYAHLYPREIATIGS